MATGTKQIDYIETGTAELQNGVTLQSWGRVTVHKCGHVVVVGFSGLRFSAAHSSSFASIKLPWKSISYYAVSGTKDGNFLCMIGESDVMDTVYFNSVSTGTNYFGQLVYLTND